MNTLAGRMVVGADCESHLVVRGLAAPPLVCKTLFGRGAAGRALEVFTSALPPGSHITERDGDGVAVLLDRHAAVKVWPDLIANDSVHLVGHNYFFDLGLMAHHAGDVAYIFDAIDGGPKGKARGPRISDTGIRQTLYAIAHGEYKVDRLGPKHVVVDAGYALSDLVKKHLGLDITEDKRSTPKSFRGDTWGWVCNTQGCPDCDVAPWLGIGLPPRTCETCEGFGLVGPWRLRYCQLHGVNVHDWPRPAVDYAIMDAKYAEMVFELQGEAVAPRDAPGPIIDSGTGLYVNEWQQTEAAWALHLMSLWGPRTEPEAVERTKAAWQKSGDICRELGQRLGFVRANGTEDRTAMTRFIQGAYAARGLDAPRNPPTDNNLAKARGMVDEVDEARQTLGKYEPPVGWRPPKVTAAWKRALTTDTPFAIYLAEARELELGNLKYDSETLTESAHPELREYAKHTTFRDNLTKYAYILDDGTRTAITSRPGWCVATGRTSWKSPPMQGPPGGGGYREAHIPRPGRLYGHGDYDTIELCSQAQNLLDWGMGSTMADKINAGIDLHTDLAADELDIDYEEGMRLKAIGDPALIAARNRAKVVNFGCWGRMGAAALVRQKGALEVFDPGRHDIDHAEAAAKQLRDTWLRKNPEAELYFQWCRDLLDMGGGETVIAQLMSGRLRMVDRLTKLCNTFFQGRTADGAKLGIYRVSREMYTDTASPMFGARQWLLLHDEVLASFDRDRAQAGVTRMCVVLREAMEVLVPDVRVNISPVLARRWSKKADTVMVGGVLVPWEPWKRIKGVEGGATWSPYTGPRRGWVCTSIDDTVTVRNTKGKLKKVLNDGGLAGSARHYAECFVLGEEPML